MSKKIKISPASMRVENLDLFSLLKNMDKLGSPEVGAVIPYTMNVYFLGAYVTFTWALYGNPPSLTVSCENPEILQKITKRIQEVFGGE